MKFFSLRYVCVSIPFFIVIHDPIFSQIPDFSKLRSLHEGDSVNIVYLIHHGVKIVEGKAICWFPKDSLSEDQMKEISVIMNSGIRGAEKFIGAPLPWQVQQPAEPYTFYFRFDRFVSHASGAGFVSIPFWRIKAGKAPWLHEAMHEMLNTKMGSWDSKTVPDKESDTTMPLWLFEGLPDYVSLNVSVIENLPWFDIFSNSQQTNIDSLFVKEIRSDKGPYILTFIGTKGVIPELYSNERMLYAPAFYHGSASFTEFLANKYGIKMLLAAISSFKKELATIERLTGKPLEMLRKEWMAKLKIEQ